MRFFDIQFNGFGADCCIRNSEHPLDPKLSLIFAVSLTTWES